MAHESDFEDMYQDFESNYDYYEYEYRGSNVNINYPKFYEDLPLKKWDRVISEENVDDDECQESSGNND